MQDEHDLQETNSNPNDCVNWHTVDDVPHMELVRHNIKIKPLPNTPEGKIIQAPILELRCAQVHAPFIREAILTSKTNTRGHGVFIPTSFFKAEPEAVYKTALRHMQYLQTLKVIPVSAIHHTHGPLSVGGLGLITMMVVTDTKLEWRQTVR